MRLRKLFRLIRRTDEALAPLVKLLTVGGLGLMFIAGIVGALERVLICGCLVLFSGLTIGAGLPALQGVLRAILLIRKSIQRSEGLAGVWYHVLVLLFLSGVMLGLVWITTKLVCLIVDWFLFRLDHATAACDDESMSTPTDSTDIRQRAIELVGHQWAEWYLLTPQERWRESDKLWATYLELGGSLDPEPDTQSPFFNEDEWRELSADGRPSLRVMRRSGV